MKKILYQVLVALGLLLVLLSMSGCSSKQPMTPLSEKELKAANQWFSEMVITGDKISTSEISCFFTCYYSDPREIELSSFLAYCPVGEILEDADTEEFLECMAAAQWPDPDGMYQKPSDFILPVRRLPNAAVSAILMQYAGITTADVKSFSGTVYLEEYDSFYNFTSDYAPGYFQCVGGETDGFQVRFWSETTAEGTRDVLTLQLENEQYLICSFLPESLN